MLYAAIMCFNSLREITASLLAETRKLAHLGISCSKLADANKRTWKPYLRLYTVVKYRFVLSPDSRSRKSMRKSMFTFNQIKQ
ncbi:DUF4372 domain-containing protein [Duncaniella freteri]|uniref:DUF4372 domain-containing protein n=1 Tax=Duncaniella freteri TaxID=2530391 RepID=UPI002575EB25|nr:DUF4372 domain-containing protein [Duncaniella freteri]